MKIVYAVCQSVHQRDGFYVWSACLAQGSPVWGSMMQVDINVKKIYKIYNINRVTSIQPYFIPLNAYIWYVVLHEHTCPLKYESSYTIHVCPKPWLVEIMIINI